MYVGHTQYRSSVDRLVKTVKTTAWLKRSHAKKKQQIHADNCTGQNKKSYKMYLDVDHN